MADELNRNPDQKPQVPQRHPDEWQSDLNPNHLAGQNIGREQEPTARQWTAFHLRKRGQRLGGLDDNDLKHVPLVPEGGRLQQGATYVNLADDRPCEFTATGDMIAQEGSAYAPKDKVPYEVWNRLIGEPKPGQE